MNTRNTVIIDRERWDNIRYSFSFISQLDFIFLKEKDGSYTIKKDRAFGLSEDFLLNSEEELNLFLKIVERVMNYE